MKTILQATLSLCLGLALAQVAMAQGTIGITPLTDDASTGISTSINYTHAISGGTAATINGVNFDLLDAGNTPANFTWDTHGFSKNQIGCCNNSHWNPAAGGVTGPDLTTMLGSFTFSSNGNGSPGQQTYTLSGLIPGEAYSARLYIRMWDDNPAASEGFRRPLDITFTNGGDVDALPTFPADAPSLILGGGSDHQAYYVSYDYTAQGTELSINAAVAAIGGSNSGSAHLYALSNQSVDPLPPPPLEPMAAMIGAGVGIAGADTFDTPGGDRFNVDVTKFVALGAGTYDVDDFGLNVITDNTGTVTPVLVTGNPGSYTTLWVGPTYDPTTTGIQSDAYATGTQQFTLLDPATDVRAGFFTENLGSDIIALDANNSNNDSTTNHDANGFPIPTVGSTVDGFSHTIARTYAFEVNVTPIPEPTTFVLGLFGMLGMMASHRRRLVVWHTTAGLGATDEEPG